MVVGDVSAQTVRTMEAVADDDAVQTEHVRQRRLESGPLQTTISLRSWVEHCKSVAIEAIVTSV